MIRAKIFILIYRYLSIHTTGTWVDISFVNAVHKALSRPVLALLPIVLLGLNVLC